jgi:protein-S-isoprenylcysteine O-methyltransferase Ste14
MNNLYFRAVRASIFGFLAMAALLFMPAGTFDYWQAFVFLAVFVGASAAITVYLARKDPKLLERRMHVGPTAEKETTQKIIMVFALLGFIALLVIPAFDRRFMWCPVPPYVSVLGDFLVALGFLLVYFVIRENSYAASTVQVTEGQTVISTGPYAIVRHPMYAGVLPLLIGTPLALGSWSGLFALILFMPALIWRLLDEERFLHKNLPGYTDYTRKVRYRLMPFVW